MTTKVEDFQLDTELQELYLISKHWISDLEFFIQDIGFLKRLFINSFSPLGTDEMMHAIREIEDRTAGVKNNIISYLRLLQPLINKTNQTYPLWIIETHSLLGNEMDALLQSFKSVKKAIFQMNGKKLQ